MNGWASDPSGRNPGWRLWMNADPTQPKNWTQLTPSDPPEGFNPDAGNPGYYFRGGDPADKANWWSDSTVVAAATGTVLACDVASYQDADVSGYIQRYGLQHVVIRMYQKSVEGAQLQNHSRQQVASAVAAGASVSTPYLWLYSSVDPAQQVNEAIDLAQDCGIGLTLMFLDIEPFTDRSLPSVAQIQAALDACAARGVRGAIYSGAWVWPQLGNPSFPGVPLWYAVYDHVPKLDVAPFGDMVLVGKQFDDHAADGSALDMDVFDASVV